MVKLKGFLYIIKAVQTVGFMGGYEPRPYEEVLNTSLSYSRKAVQSVRFRAPQATPLRNGADFEIYTTPNRLQNIKDYAKNPQFRNKVRT